MNVSYVAISGEAAVMDISCLVYDNKSEGSSILLQKQLFQEAQYSPANYMTFPATRTLESERWQSTGGKESMKRCRPTKGRLRSTSDLTHFTDVDRAEISNRKDKIAKNGKSAEVFSHANYFSIVVAAIHSRN